MVGVDRIAGLGAFPSRRAEIVHHPAKPHFERWKFPTTSSIFNHMTYVVKPKFHHPELPKNSLGYTRRDYEGKISTLCAEIGRAHV